MPAPSVTIGSQVVRSVAFVARRLVSIGVVLLFWWAAAALSSRGVLPGPVETAETLRRLVSNFSFAPPLFATLFRTGAGFSAALVLGVAYGVLSAQYLLVRQLFAPLVGLLMFFPTLGIVLIGLVVLGTGSLTAAVTITALAVFPTVGVYVRDALSDLDPGIVELADAYKIQSLKRFAHVYLPYLIPTFLGGGRVAFNVAWKVILLAEVFGFPRGLGFQVRNAFNAYQLELLLSWLVVFVVALLVIEQAVRFIERRVVRWSD